MSALSRLLNSRKNTTRLSSGALLVLFLAVIVLPLIQNSKASAFTTVSQTDWSGGQGPSIVNQYASATNVVTTSTPNQITLDDSTYDNTTWCHDTGCTADFIYRKPITLTNSGGTLNDKSVRLIIPYAAGMASDFSDIRFEDSDGVTDLPYYISHRINNTKAYVWVKVPVIGTGDHKIYVYYGNNGINSLSDVNNGVVDFGDNFDGGTLEPALWDTYLTGNIPENGELLDPWALTSIPTFDNSVDRVLQYDYRFDAAFCNEGGSGGTVNFLHSADVVNGITSINCTNHTFQLWNAQHYGADANVNSIVFSMDNKITIRQVAYAAGGVDFYYSTDDGLTFQQFDNYTNEGNNFRNNVLALGGDQPNANHYYFSNVTITAPIADVAFSIGAESRENLVVGDVASNTFDLGTNIVYGTVDGISTGTGTVQYLVRSGSQSDMSDAPDFTSCDPLASGANILDSNCVTSGDQYLQYKLILSGQPPNDLTVTSVSLSYTNDTTPPDNASNLVIKTSSGGSIIAEGSSSFDTTPYYSWDAGSDADASLSGYCLYLGSSSSGDPQSDQGLLPSSSPLNTGGLCPYAISGTSLDLSSVSLTGEMTGGTTYYLNIKAYDTFGNIDASSATTNYVLATDTTAPTNASNLVIKRSSSGSVIAPNSWINVPAPYFTWDAGSDNVGGSGLQGYCLYVGEDNTADPATTKGVINVSSPLNSGGACQYATDSTNFDTSGGKLSLNSDHTYYIRVRALDNYGNLSSSTLMSSFKFDNQTPSLQTVFTPFPSVTNTKIFSATWASFGSVVDNGSGFAGFKYCVTNIIIGASGCTQSDNNWYGKAHTSGSITDTSDVVPFSDGIISTVSADASRLDDSGLGALGINFVYIALIDYAGNADSSSQTVVAISQHAAGAVTNLAATPTSNSTNAFAFSWDPPAFILGSPAKTNFCWSVNVPITTNGSNCNWTGEGVTSLPEGPYATRQGTNTMYVSAKDQTGNFNGDDAATVDFDATTISPGAPQNLELSDISIRATSTWKMAMSWTAPTELGAGVSSYRIYRSTDGSTFAQVGSTSTDNLSFIDTGLSQVLYYYEIKACDNAGSCSVASNIASKRPTGRFTTPARLTADSDQPKVKDTGTRKATIFWFTDRESDSKIAFGTTSGSYFPEEIGNSDQTSNHGVNLTNLQPGTKYYFIAKWTDQDGNTGVSTERSFTTAPAPSISDVNTSGLSISGATVTFTIADASKVNLYFGKSANFGGFKTINTATTSSTYSIALTDLDDGAKYSFKLNGVDADGNEYQGNSYNFTTPARPRIANLRFQPVDGAPSSTQKVTWTTNVLASSALNYGPKGGQQKDSLDSKLVTDHSITVQDLNDDTDYTLVARSVDAAGNAAVSDTQSFHTALDTRPPKVSDLNIETAIRGTGTEAKGQIIVSWKTDEPATSQIAYGLGQSGAFTNRTAEDSKLSLEHTVIISDLSTSSIFHVQVATHDKANNLGTSDTRTVIVGRGSDNIFSIILNALQKIFGLGS